MVIVWIFAWAIQAHEFVKDKELCMKEDMKPLVCEKFTKEQHKFENW